jgi:RNA polymerase sigma-70 factor (ECF subfamily)
MQLIPNSRNSKQKSDEELLRTYLKKQDFEILGILYSRYMHLVYGVCLKYLKNPELSKDAVINIYEKIQSTIHKHEVKNFKSWLYVVSKNHCLMELRKDSANRVFVSSEEELSNFMENAADLHPIDREQNEDLEKALADCIKRLNAEQQECIRLFYFENKCYREISAIVKLEEKKVKSFIQNGKRNLKICLEKKK